VADTVSATNNKIDNILSQQTQLQRTVDSVSQNIEKLSTVTSNQLTYLSNQSQNITEKVDKLSLQQEREARTAAVEGARGTVVVDYATGKTVSGVAAAGASEETKQSLIGSVLSGIKGILTSPLALGGAALGAAALGTAAALRKEPPGTPQAGSDAEFNLPRDTSGSRRTGGQTDQGPSLSPSGTTPSSGEYSGSLARDRKAAFEKELENPAVIRRLYNLSRSEVGKNPINQQLFSETVFNRSMFTGRSLSSTMSSVRSEGVRGGYYPVIKNYNPSPEELERFKQSVINKTMSGENNTSMATDNASLDVARRRMQAGADGRYLGVGKEGITKEYYYSGGEGAGRYRTKHGIRAQEYQRRIDQERQQQSRQKTETAPPPDASREPPQEQGRQFPTQRELYAVDEEVTSRFNELQGFVGPLEVISGYRSPSYNRRVGGAKKSQHTSGNAIDIDVRHLSIEQRQELIKNASALGYKGIGVYPNSIHLDMGSRRYWGPNYSGNSLPGWARRVMRSHMSGRFNRDDLPKQQRERQRQPDAKTQPDPDVSQPGTDKASDSGVPGIIVTPPTPDRMNLGASDVVPPKEPVKEPVKEPYKHIVTTYDSDGEKVDLKPSPTIDNMKELLKMIKEKQAQQAQSQQAQSQQAPSRRQPVVDPDFYNDTYPEGQNRDPKGGTRSAQPPKQKIKPPYLYDFNT
jgi:hypothetical protein